MSLHLLMRVLGAAAGAAATLTLNTLISSVIKFGAPATAGVRVQTNGDVQELIVSTWTSQNSGVEWIDDGGATSSDYEVKLTKTSGPTPTGPALATWHTISTTRQWTVTRSTTGTDEFIGTMDIREIADTGNSVSAGVTIRAIREDF